jgi:hypothetical protein
MVHLKLKKADRENLKKLKVFLKKLETKENIKK